MTNIIVKLQIEGMHSWDNAFEKVSFLKHPHRNLFYITCKKKVNHDDRDVEFIVFKREIEKYIKDKYECSVKNLCDFKFKSCEMIACELLVKFDLSYCSVFEDNENGAEVIK